MQAGTQIARLKELIGTLAGWAETHSPECNGIHGHDCNWPDKEFEEAGRLVDEIGERDWDPLHEEVESTPATPVKRMDIDVSGHNPGHIEVVQQETCIRLDFAGNNINYYPKVTIFFRDAKALAVTGDRIAEFLAAVGYVPEAQEVIADAAG